MTSEIRYENYKKMIMKLSWEYSFSTSFSQETLFSEGNLIYVQCKLKFDSSKSKFATYLYLCITRKFKAMEKIKNNQKLSIETFAEIENETEKEIVDNKTPESILTTHDSYQKLSKEAKDVIDIILNGPAEVIEMLTSPVRKVIQRRKVWAYIYGNLGKTKSKKVKNELRNFVSNF